MSLSFNGWNAVEPPPPVDTSADTAEVLAEMYERYGEVLYRLAYRLTGSAEDAEDVVQDVFVGLPEALRKYQEVGRMDGWIKTVTARVALTRIRQRKRRSEVTLEGVPLASRALGPEAALDRTHLERAVSTLPDKLRVVMILKEIEGYTHKEIGELLGIKQVTSQVRLHRAYGLLRDRLAAS